MSATLKIKRAAKYGMWGIVAFDMDGHEWVLNRQFKTDSPKLYETLDRVRSKLEICTKYWAKRQRRQVYGS